MRGVTLALLVISGLAGAAQDSELETMTTRLETVATQQAFDGTVEAVNRSTVAAQIAGEVTEIGFDVHDFVPQDAVILRIDDTQAQAALAQARASVAEARAGLSEATVSFRRVRDLFERQAVSQAEFDQAEAAYQAAQARLEAAQAAVKQAETRLGYTVVKAPYPGIVVERHVEVGEVVQPGTPLITGLSLERLRVNIHVPQDIAEAVRRAGTASVEMPGGSVLTSDDLTFYPYADARSRSFRVRVNLAPDGHNLYPGMMLKVSVPTGEAERLMVPARAVLRRSELRAVYVVDEDGAPRLRQVRLGNRDGDRVEVLSGLSAGETIALNPNAALARIAARKEGGDG
ncbi:efflux RND transporter periplasmic adaptor subunit [Ectothiorhodospiraceae bacterium WFHF3C12]|nr:efflux RND transporter periplasmic adaptor subunit [Ectothiorhodospiraceae bacterium WFHF3C12]